MSKWVVWAMVVAMAWAAACGGDGDGDDDDDSAGGADAAVTPDAAPSIDAATPDAATPDAAGPDAVPLVCDEFGPASTGSNPGFVPPDGTLLAYEEVAGVWQLVGPADYSCLCAGGSDTPTSVEVTLTGTTRDFQTNDVVDNVDIRMFRQGDPLTATPLATATSDASGDYSLTVPAGTGRVSLVQTDPEVSRFLDTAVVNHLFAPSAPAQMLTLYTVSELTANALPAFIGVARTVGRGLMLGMLVDCNGDRVAGAIATVSATPRTTDHLAGADTFYFSAGSTSLPVRHTQAADTNKDGLFMVIELVPTDTAYVQAWGYLPGQTPGVDDLTLLSEVPVPVGADSVGIATLEPLR